MTEPHETVSGRNCVRASDLRHKLVSDLVATGALRSPQWRHAFVTVPRHAFLPRFFRPLRQAGHYALVDGTQPGRHHEWLRLVYTNETWVTQLDGDSEAGYGITDGTVAGAPTSSSTMPALMSTMLESLDISDDHHVLEVGTGTGYNAALLCERLGSDRVTTIDVDPLLVDHPHARLTGLGYTPTVATSDARYGYPPNAPYDRILATCSMPRIPTEWLAQLNPGGVLLASLHRGLGGGPLVRLSMTPDGTARGHFLRDFAAFMPARAHAAPEALELLRQVNTSSGDAKAIRLSGEELDDPDFAFVAALLCPADTVRIDVAADHGGWERWLLTADGSWAYQTTTPQSQLVMVQGGPARPWERLEDIHHTWTRLGRPTRDSFGLTVTPDGQYVWLDTPESGRTWELP